MRAFQARNESNEKYCVEINAGKAINAEICMVFEHSILHFFRHSHLTAKIGFVEIEFIVI